MSCVFRRDINTKPQQSRSGHPLPQNCQICGNFVVARGIRTPATLASFIAYAPGAYPLFISINCSTVILPIPSMHPNPNCYPNINTIQESNTATPTTRDVCAKYAYMALQRSKLHKTGSYRLGCSPSSLVFMLVE